jgi:ATP-dependent helicase/nuclease subunit B
MQEEIFRAVESGATVITASRRLARVLAREFHSFEAARGSTVWNRPDILPLDAYLDRAWSEWLSRHADENAPHLLDTLQEQMLWERIIRESPEGRSLLQIPETASEAMRTWRLIHEYRLPVDGSFEAAGDWAAFANWVRDFRRQCAANRWLERARLADYLRHRMRGGEVETPSQVFAAGFDDMTPQQTEFFASLGEWSEVRPPDHAPSVERCKLPDSSNEMRAAAQWARGLLEKDPTTQIGIVVVPDVTRARSKIERTLGEVLEPDRTTGDRERAFHISAGPPLGDDPMVRAALLMLEFALGSLPLPRAGMLLRSPFLGGWEKEWTRRAQLDARLRRKSAWNVSCPLLAEGAGNCPDLQRRARRVEKLLAKWAPEQRPSGWSRAIEDLLEAFGWPGDRTPTSREFQVIARWRELLAVFAALDRIAPAMNLAQAIDCLRHEAANTQFQVEDEGAPVQAMGMLEASGLRFDHLWILGLHDEALPAPAHPNPFLPLALQLEYRLPHSSAERELEFSATLLDRLMSMAPDVVLSYPATEGDRILSPSPLVADGFWSEVASPANGWITSMRASAVFEEIPSGAAPPLASSDSAGGSSLFKDMAQCPFRAFARHRLGAQTLEEADVGLSYRDRGSTVHAALEFIWRKLGSRERLLDASASELEDLVARGADAAVAKLGPGIGREIEQRRLQKLVPAWLEIEKARPEFSVSALEVRREVEIGGLQVRVRADRVDALPDGREIILDYKTGQLKSRGWDGERLDEPQLPLYCATNDHAVAGAAFALIRTGELKFRGLAANGVHLPALQKMTVQPPLAFEQQLTAWHTVLEALAENFRAGCADVDPKPDVCDNCGLRALCRIREAGA